MSSQFDREIMRELLDYARQGIPLAYPNPLVACFIVHKEKIVAKGFHEKFGSAHAEVNAINNLPENAPIEECVLYVNLEPCSHHGKTPPCADLIIRKGFKKVVVSNLDPNPLVSGKGIKKLKEAGVEAVTGILNEEGRALNRRFFIFHEEKRPYVILKWAETADGFISRLPVPKDRKENMISTTEQLIETHKIRAGVDAIMVGKNTAVLDDPELTTRLVKGKNPARIVLDRELEIPATHKIYNEMAPTIVINTIKEEKKNNIHFLRMEPGRMNLKLIFENLYQLGIQSVLVEGGAKILEDCLNEGFKDEVIVHCNDQITFGSGLIAPKFRK